jgi:hypothetical protein
VNIAKRSYAINDEAVLNYGSLESLLPVPCQSYQRHDKS